MPLIFSIFSQSFSILLSLIGISFIIIFHEFGHYIFCKLFKVHTPTFSIGIGKILFSKKIGDTNFCISAGPIGGYVEVASENGPEGSLGFNQIPYYQKVLIMLGGIGFNFILTYVFLVALFFTGMPESGAGPYEPCTTTISSIQTNSANASTLQVQDKLISINHQNLGGNLALARKIITEQTALKAMTLPAQIERSGTLLDINLQLKGEKTPASLSKQLEISFTQKPGLSIIESLRMGIVATHFYLIAIAHGLKSMITARTTQGFVGPLMAVAASSKSAQKGFSSLIFLLAIISINLGFMNLLPLPIFDGGQFVIFTTEAIIRRGLSERTRHWIAISSWILAIGLLVIFTIRDIFTLLF